MACDPQPAAQSAPKADPSDPDEAPRPTPPVHETTPPSGTTNAPSTPDEDTTPRIDSVEGAHGDLRFREGGFGPIDTADLPLSAKSLRKRLSGYEVKRRKGHGEGIDYELSLIHI